MIIPLRQVRNPLFLKGRRKEASVRCERNVGRVCEDCVISEGLGIIETEWCTRVG